MTLRVALEKAVVDSFVKLDSVFWDIQYHSLESSEYNSDSGSVGFRDVANSPQLMRIPVYDCVDEKIEVTFESSGSNKRYVEKKCIIIQSQLLFTPSDKDIIKHKLTNNRIASIEEDPASIVWILGLVSGK